MPKHKKSKSNSEITLCCQTCGKELGTKLTIGDLKDKIPDFDPKETHYRHGLCDTCKAELESGCTFFQDKEGRCVKVSLEATRAKISEAYWGKVVHVPQTVLDELIRVYLSSQPKSPGPPESGELGSSRADGDNG